MLSLEYLSFIESSFQEWFCRHFYNVCGKNRKKKMREEREDKEKSRKGGMERGKEGERKEERNVSLTDQLSYTDSGPVRQNRKGS